MATENLHDFFVTSGGVAGALIGLLFVAISVAEERLSTEGEGPVHRVRATAALTAFTNALVVSLFGLIPGETLGDVAVTVSCVGLLSVIAQVLSLIRAKAIRLGTVRDLVFLAGLTAVFVVQLINGLRLGNGDDAGPMRTLAIVVVVCFLIGVARAWELIGGPSIGFAREVTRLGRDVGQRRAKDDED